MVKDGLEWSQMVSGNWIQVVVYDFGRLWMVLVSCRWFGWLKMVFGGCSWFQVVFCSGSYRQTINSCGFWVVLDGFWVVAGAFRWFWEVLDSCM